MIPYAWTCHACGGSNPAGGDKCAACGCDAVASRAELERALPDLKKRNAAASLPQQATGLQVLVGIAATGTLITGGLMWFFSGKTWESGLVVLAGYLLAKLAGRLGKREQADTSNDAQN